MKSNDDRNIFAWCMYDWANSAFATTVIAALLPIYFATVVIPTDGLVLNFLGLKIFTNATTLWGFLSGTAALFVFITAPILGAIADLSQTKKRFMMTFCFGGSLFTALLFFCRSGDVWKTMIIFFFANVCFTSANIFYDAFLPQITSRNQIDMVSGKGYAFGYLGGGLQFLICMALIMLHDKIGIDKILAIRISLLFSGLWWAGFSIITFMRLDERKLNKASQEQYQGKYSPYTYAKNGVLQTWNTISNVKKHKNLALFLLAFMFYNDGIQTVIRMAVIFGKDELRLKNEVLMGTLLLIQFVGIGGALLFSRIARKFGAKKILIFVLFLWSGILCYAYCMSGPIDFLILGVAVGLVLGGSQSISRSLYGTMVPENASAQFFGFYSVFDKFSSIWGPFVFAIIRQITGTSRLSILSLIVFFVIGIVLLFFVDDKRKQ